MKNTTASVFDPPICAPTLAPARLTNAGAPQPPPGALRMKTPSPPVPPTIKAALTRLPNTATARALSTTTCGMARTAVTRPSAAEACWISSRASAVTVAWLSLAETGRASHRAASPMTAMSMMVNSGPARPRRFQFCVVDIVIFLRSGVCTPVGMA